MSRKGTGKKALAEVADLKARWEEWRDETKQYRDAMALEYAYNLKLKQHSSPDPNKPLARKPLTVSTLDLYDITRYTSAQLAGSAIYLDVQPRYPGRDAVEQRDLDDAAEIAKARLDDILHDTDLGYPMVRRRVLRMGQAARAGACRWDLVPGGAEGPCIVPRILDAGNLTWDSRFLHFNEYGCNILFERIEKVPLDEIRANKEWRNGDLVSPDDGERAIDEKNQSPKRDAQNKRPTATLVVAWIKDDPDEIDVQVGESTKLDPSEWYMACGTCGYTERDLRGPGYLSDTLPEQMDCPQCGYTEEAIAISQMDRIENETEIGSAPAYEDKHRRIIFAPFSPDAGALRDGPWPKGLRNFPYMMHVSDPYPLEPYGNSQTFLNMDLQSMKNESLVAGFEQMRRNRDLTVVKKDALWDAAEEPYQFDGTGDTVAYAATYDDLMGMKHFQGSGLNPAYGLWFDTIDGELNKHRGTGQAALSPQQMKGVQVGTMARSMETGDVPVDETLAIFREDEEQFIARGWELYCGAMSGDQWQKVSGPKGDVAFRVFNAGEMPSFKLKVNAAPDLNAADREQLKSAVEFSKIESPALMRFAAEKARLPRTLIDDLVKEVMERAAPALPGAPGTLGNGPLPVDGPPQATGILPVQPEPVAMAGG